VVEKSVLSCLISRCNPSEGGETQQYDFSYPGRLHRKVLLYRRSVGKDIRLYECKNCVVHAADESKVVVQGLDGYIVAEKNGQLLVCSLKEEQRIKEFGK
jgi:hypothetical protein